MKHSIALVTGTTSGLGYAAARMLAAEGWREIIVTGRSLAQVQETAAQLAAETKTQVFTPLELELERRPAFSPPSPSWSSEVGRSISCCSMPGWSQVRSACSLRRASRLLRPRSSAIIN
jgi:NADP-dependent 3-hydroxy acid dehydrogenase YdfG